MIELLMLIKFNKKKLILKTFLLFKAKQNKRLVLLTISF